MAESRSCTLCIFFAFSLHFRPISGLFSEDPAIRQSAYYLIKKQQYNIRLLVNNLFAMKDVRRNIGSCFTNASTILKKAQNLFFINTSLENRFYSKLFRNSKIFSFRYSLVPEWIYYCLIQ